MSTLYFYPGFSGFPYLCACLYHILSHTCTSSTMEARKSTTVDDLLSSLIRLISHVAWWAYDSMHLIFIGWKFSFATADAGIQTNELPLEPGVSLVNLSEALLVAFFSIVLIAASYYWQPNKLKSCTIVSIFTNFAVWDGCTNLDWITLYILVISFQQLSPGTFLFWMDILLLCTWGHFKTDLSEFKSWLYFKQAVSLQDGSKKVMFVGFSWNQI